MILCMYRHFYNDNHLLMFLRGIKNTKKNSPVHIWFKYTCDISNADSIVIKFNKMTLNP